MSRARLDLTDAERRQAHQDRMREHREAQLLAGRCRQCQEPAARRKDGALASSCQRHLDADAQRKKEKRKKP